MTRTVCFNWAENSCKWSIDVQIKKCDGYFVYELPPTPVCSLKYCGAPGPKDSCEPINGKSFLKILRLRSFNSEKIQPNLSPSKIIKVILF